MRQRCQLHVCLGVLAVMSVCAFVEPTEKAIETEIVEDEEFTALEQALLLAERAACGDKRANSDLATPSPRSVLDGVVDVEDCVAGAEGDGCGVPLKKRKRPQLAERPTPSELLRSRGRSAIFVTEICSQVPLCTPAMLFQWCSVPPCRS